MRKIIVLISFLVLLVVIFIITIFKPRDYELTYELDNFVINESFNRELGYYKFLINYDDKVFPIIMDQRFTSRRRLITDIEKIVDEDVICLSIRINDSLHPVCYLDDILISVYLLNENIRSYFPELISDFSTSEVARQGQVSIFNTLDKSFFIWNYRGYYLINSDQKRNITILDSDEYHNALAFKAGNYLLTPNYDQNHNFNEIFLINSRNFELSVITLEDSISFNSYFQGKINRNVYIVDRRNRVQHSINLRRGRSEIIGTENTTGRWYNRGWEDISLIRLSSEDHKFVYNHIHHFEVIDSTLFNIIGNQKIKISNQEIKLLVDIIDDQVFYLVGNTLYMFSNSTGEVRLLQNSEWHFNYQNKIFIFN